MVEGNEGFSQEYNELWNSYFLDDGITLKNKLNIDNPFELDKKEAEITFSRLVDLYENPIEGSFDKKHLCDIHRYLFQDLYDWAGEFRDVHMRKNCSNFASIETISPSLDYELSLMNNELREIHGQDEFACFLADYYIILINIHPFREGNGRTIREFLREFCETKTKNAPFGECELNWELVDEKVLYDGMRDARNIRTIIENEFRKALVRKDNVKHL